MYVISSTSYHECITIQYTYHSTDVLEDFRQIFFQYLASSTFNMKYNMDVNICK